MRYDCKEDIIQLTPLWTGERFDNGRPKVPDSVLERLRNVTFEEAWHLLWEKGYKYQYECRFKRTRPDLKLVGRAVTAVMIPKRPDLDDYLLKYGNEQEGRDGFYNQWVIDSLQENDVLVVDMYDKISEGTFVGGNLSTAIAARTKRGGAVIWGGIRDLEQVTAIPNIQIFYRDNDPTGIADCTMIGMNVPCRIGNAVCMPGDVVLGTISGVIFIPPHMAEAVATEAEKAHIRDRFAFIRLEERIYTTAQIDRPWTLEIWKDFLNWFEQDECAAEYRHLDWTEELEAAKNQVK